MTAYAWFIMGQSFATTALVFGVWFSYAVFFVAMLEAFDWSRGGAAMAFSVGNVVQAATSPLVGGLTDRWGPRVVVVGGLGAMAVGLAACSLVQALWHLIVLFGVIVGFGVGLAGQVSHAALLSRWFVKRRGTIIGFAFAGMGLGVKVMGPLSQALMSRLGWRYAFVALGGITALYALSVLLTLRNQPGDVGQQPYGAGEAANQPETAPPQEAPWTVRQALRTAALLGPGVGAGAHSTGHLSGVRASGGLPDGPGLQPRPGGGRSGLHGGDEFVRPNALRGPLRPAGTLSAA